MDSNLPQIRREGIFIKIKKWFNKLFGKEKIEEYSVQEPKEVINNSEKEVKNNSFKDAIKAEVKDRILFLQRQLKEKKIEISDLTDEELDDIIELYEKQIEVKENMLNNLRKNSVENEE